MPCVCNDCEGTPVVVVKLHGSAHPATALEEPVVKYLLSVCKGHPGKESDQGFSSSINIPFIFGLNGFLSTRGGHLRSGADILVDVSRASKANPLFGLRVLKLFQEGYIEPSLMLLTNTTNRVFPAADVSSRLNCFSSHVCIQAHGQSNTNVGLYTRRLRRSVR